MSLSNLNSNVLELAKLLKINAIDETMLLLCIKLLDEGVDPKVLAQHINSINAETKAIS